MCRLGYTTLSFFNTFYLFLDKTDPCLIQCVTNIVFLSNEYPNIVVTIDLDDCQDKKMINDYLNKFSLEKITEYFGKELSLPKKFKYEKI